MWERAGRGSSDRREDRLSGATRRRETCTCRCPSVQSNIEATCHAASSVCGSFCEYALISQQELLYLNAAAAAAALDNSVRSTGVGVSRALEKPGHFSSSPDHSTARDSTRTPKATQTRLLAAGSKIQDNTKGAHLQLLPPPRLDPPHEPSQPHSPLPTRLQPLLHPPPAPRQRPRDW